MPDRSRHLVWLDDFQVDSAGPSSRVGDEISSPVMPLPPGWADWYQPAFGAVIDDVTDLHEHHNLIHLTHQLTGRVHDIRARVAALPPGPQGLPPLPGPSAGSGLVIPLTAIRPRRPEIVVPEGKHLLGYLVGLQ